MVFCYCIGLLCYCFFFFFFLFFSILGLGWLLCSCSPVLPNFMKSSLKVFQLTHFFWEVLCPAVSSHPLSSTHSAVSWVHPWPDSYHQSRWKWSVDRPFHSFSNSEPGDQFSCSRNCTWSLQVPDLAHPEVDSKISPDLSATGATSGLQSCMWLYRTAQAQVSCLLGVKHTNMCFK